MRFDIRVALTVKTFFNLLGKWMNMHETRVECLLENLCFHKQMVELILS